MYVYNYHRVSIKKELNLNNRIITLKVKYSQKTNLKRISMMMYSIDSIHNVLIPINKHAIN
jgi:hypothetical protein